MNYFELPQKMTALMTEQSKAWQEATQEYYGKLEAIQRQTLKQSQNLWEDMMPKDNPIWDMQKKMLHQGFDLFDKMGATTWK